MSKWFLWSKRIILHWTQRKKLVLGNYWSTAHFILTYVGYWDTREPLIFWPISHNSQNGSPWVVLQYLSRPSFLSWVQCNISRFDQRNHLDIIRQCLFFVKFPSSFEGRSRTQLLFVAEFFRLACQVPLGNWNQKWRKIQDPRPSRKSLVNPTWTSPFVLLTSSLGSLWKH